MVLLMRFPCWQCPDWFIQSDKWQCWRAPSGSGAWFNQLKKAHSARRETDSEISSRTLVLVTFQSEGRLPVSGNGFSFRFETVEKTCKPSTARLKLVQDSIKHHILPCLGKWHHIKAAGGPSNGPQWAVLQFSVDLKSYYEISRHLLSIKHMSINWGTGAWQLFGHWHRDQIIKRQQQQSILSESSCEASLD